MTMGGGFRTLGRAFDFFFFGSIIIDERLLWSLPRSGEKFRNHQEAVGQSAEMGGAQSGRNKDYWTAGG